ncbi:cysteine-rich CWC family protein [Undibacterium sp. TS12]|uniref:cysteine-rich CWC family protein n=1 Tax=Undibacterium sp. TS12 TaxID=2908202 RepID=UPI001F4CD622|nr:cysteine-rich CWC family protein [Undibacterium sp. TS12]MCH8621129.1 cysteine-rich CWC family protein [Undibacterium sp. TS12]
MSICPRCQTEFTCAMADNTGQACWCTALPPISFANLPGGELKSEALCFCPHCLPVWKAEREALNNAADNTSPVIQLP